MKYDILGLIAYLNTHPTLAKKMAAVLEPYRETSGDENSDGCTRYNHYSHFKGETPSEEHMEAREYDAQEVGEALGMSAKWVKEHRELLPATAYRRSTHGHRAWLFTNQAINLLKDYR